MDLRFVVRADIQWDRKLSYLEDFSAQRVKLVISSEMVKRSEIVAPPSSQQSKLWLGLAPHSFHHFFHLIFTTSDFLLIFRRRRLSTKTLRAYF